MREPPAATSRWIGPVAGFAGLLAGVSILPYAFPHTGFVKGASYQAGFNNAAAYVIYILLVGLPALALVRALPALPARPVAHLAKAGLQPPTPVAWAVLAAHAALFAALYGYKGRFPFAEALYFQTIVYRMTTGEIPYVDFSFYYGPGMLYPAFWLATLFGVEAGYGMAFVATYLLGLYLLYVALRAVISDTAAASLWFAVLGPALFNPWTGLNVTLFRYVLPLVTFAAAWRHLRRGEAFLAVYVAFAVALLYSFDTAAVAVASVVLLTVLVAARTRLGRDTVGESVTSGMFILGVRAAGVLLFGLAVVLVAFYAIDPTWRSLVAYPSIALSYGSGAHNYPILPTLPLLTVAGCTIVGLALSWRILRAGGAGGYEDLAIGSVALVLLMQRGAFGVAEPTHLAYYGLGAFLLTALLLPALPRGVALRRWALVAILLGVALPLQYLHVFLFVPFFQTRLAQAGPAEVSGPQRSVEQTLGDLVERLGRDRYYFMYKLDYYSFPVYRRFGLRYPGRFTMLAEAIRPDDVSAEQCLMWRRRTIVLARTSDLSVAEHRSPVSGPLKSTLDRVTGAATVGSPLFAYAYRSEEQLYRPLVQHFLEAYEEVGREGAIVALAPKGDANCRSTTR